MKKIVYVMGFGRSGSTFYESLLQARENLTGLGEIKYLAERGVLKNERCSCGSLTKECVFWSTLITDMGDWDYSEVSRVTDLLESSKSFFWNLLQAKRGKLDAEISLYQSFNDRLFELAGQNDGFIDSSKMPARAFFLAYGRKMPFDQIIWFVRDPRGVAWSCMKDVDRPEAQNSEDAKMPKWGYFSSLAKWVVNTHVSHYVARQYAECTVLKRYEDLSSEYDTGMNSAPDQSQTVQHSVSGNPRRFTGGLDVFRFDNAWEHKLTNMQKRLGMVLCLPAIRRVRQFELSK